MNLKKIVGKIRKKSLLSRAATRRLRSQMRADAVVAGRKAKKRQRELRRKKRAA